MQEVYCLTVCCVCGTVQTDPSLINELRDDVRTECAKFGDVRKVQVHDVSSATFCTVNFFNDDP